MTDTRRYPAQVFWSDEDEGYIAVAPDLPGCSAFGDTQQDALAELQHAIAAWKEAATKAGNPVPKPSHHISQFSGKFPLRMTKTLHAQLAKQAEIEGVSLNTYINVLLAGRHEKRVAHQAVLRTSRSTSEGERYYISDYYDLASEVATTSQWFQSSHSASAREIVLLTPAQKYKRAGA